MPDYTYHPFLKHVLFQLSPEDARRVTLRLLEIQSRTRLGRRVFRMFGHGLPGESMRVRAFGIDFPGPIGLAPGIDIDGSTLQVMQYLGFGFQMLGPAGVEDVSRRYSTDPLRIPETHTLVHSLHAGVPGTARLADTIDRSGDLKIPVGIALRGDRFEEAIARARDRAAFFTLPSECADETDTLCKIRAATLRPLLLRINPNWSNERVDTATGRALDAGWNGCVAVSSAPTRLLSGGEMDGPFLRTRALEVVERVARRYAEAFPIIGSGGIMTPDDATAILDAGATLLELYAGLVYSGPGLPGRIVHALEQRRETKAVHPDVTDELQTDTLRPHTDVRGSRDSRGWILVAFTGAVLFVSGVFALVLAATIKLLPYDVAYLGMSMKDLCDRNECRIVHFMAHDRVSFGGSIMSIGAVYIWLAAGPLRRGEAWAWWTLVLSATAGFASFLTYLGYGYLDLWHGRATLALLPLFVLGMMMSFTRLRGPKGMDVLLRPGARAWLYSPGGMGRTLLLFTAGGMILGGLIIMCVGMTSIFVPQDLEYMRITIPQLDAINPRLAPLIAHDRAGFGGGLCSGGLAIFFSAWCGLRPGARGLWWTFLAAGLFGFGTAIGIHPIVGYTSFIHLLPAYVGALAFLIGMNALRKPVCRADDTSGAFPDY